MSSHTGVSQASLLQEEYRLGPLVEMYQTQVTRSGNLVFGGMLIFLVLYLCGLITPIEVMLFPLISASFSSSSLLLMVMMFGFPLLLILVSCSFLFWLFRKDRLWATPIRRKIVVSLYAGGIVYHEGRKQQVVTWEQIRFVERLAIRRWKTLLRYYKLKMDNQTELALLVVIAHVEELGAAIEREVNKRLLPEVLARYTAHKPITFTGLCLNQEGISNSAETLPWHEVEQVILSVEALTIKERGIAKEWLTAPITQFRNACLLEALLEHIKEEKGLVVRERR
ncbi:MAG: hypothetical protein H0W02_03460 [Ktedonobacteraceae bacterium]|nr:hypothetical protein [Ktedonobacteraceae bacterium]